MVCCWMFYNVGCYVVGCFTMWDVTELDVLHCGMLQSWMYYTVGCYRAGHYAVGCNTVRRYTMVWNDSLLDVTHAHLWMSFPVL